MGALDERGDEVDRRPAQLLVNLVRRRLLPERGPG
jgi:hypothetical protein